MNINTANRQSPNKRQFNINTSNCGGHILLTCIDINSYNTAQDDSVNDFVVPFEKCPIKG